MMVSPSHNQPQEHTRRQRFEGPYTLDPCNVILQHQRLLLLHHAMCAGNAQLPVVPQPQHCNMKWP